MLCVRCVNITRHSTTLIYVKIVPTNVVAVNILDVLALMRSVKNICVIIVFNFVLVLMQYYCLMSLNGNKNKKKYFLVRTSVRLLEKRKRQEEEEVLKSNKEQKIINERFSKPIFTITTDILKYDNFGLILHNQLRCDLCRVILDRDRRFDYKPSNRDDKTLCLNCGSNDYCISKQCSLF